MDIVNLAGRVAIVTGAGRGLGRSHAELLADRGAQVVVNDVAGADEAATAIRAAGGMALADNNDISTPEGAGALVARAVDTFGKVDIIVNNAAVGQFTKMGDVTIEEYEFVRRVGLDGTFYVTRSAWPHLARNKYGRIVVTSSAVGLLGAPSISYAIAKAGLYGLMRSAAVEGAPDGILVNSLAPMASTPMADEFNTEERAEYMRLEFPTSLVSPLVAALVSDRLNVTGKHFDVGGGWLGSSFFGTSPGIFDKALTPETVLDRLAEVLDRNDYIEFSTSRESLSMIDIARERAPRT